MTVKSPSASSTTRLSVSPISLHILVVDGNTAETNAAMAAHGQTAFGPLFEETLRECAVDLGADVSCTICHPADAPPDEPWPDLNGFDGVIWTGSALNLYDGGPEIAQQITLSRQVFKSGTPYFGACWGLQVAAAAAGGSVRRNPLGREAYVGRAITMTDNGRNHPLLADRPLRWDALAIHLDEVEQHPPDSTVLASNAMSQVQAMEITHDGGVFWGVQYHPEFSPLVMAQTCQRLIPALVDDGIFADGETADRHIQALRNPGDHGAFLQLSDDILQKDYRQIEIRNWLRHQVIPYYTRQR